MTDKPCITGKPCQRWMRALLLIYLLLLVWTVVWKLGVPYIGSGSLRVVNLVPFRGARPLELAFNAALFAPFGLYLRQLKPRWPLLRRCLSALLLSLLLETAQYALAVGRSDITDVVMNTLGAGLGAGLTALLGRRLGKRASRVILALCAAFTVLLLLAAVWFACHLRFREPG